ncbi:hypothetical protein PHBOTO_006090 [Pseudozyma hubeiensis]|nr:hypothetical protein PHBOTO_006090 [Pseudozyma hubeiensis]
MTSVNASSTAIAYSRCRDLFFKVAVKAKVPPNQRQSISKVSNGASEVTSLPLSNSCRGNRDEFGPSAVDKSQTQLPTEYDLTSVTVMNGEQIGTLQCC